MVEVTKLVATFPPMGVPQIFQPLETRRTLSLTYGHSN
jgi:hypothetical protein